MSRYFKAVLLLFVLCWAQPASRAEEAKALTDTDFLQKSVVAGNAEVQFGKLAARNATSDRVREFAERMVKDHTNANKQLAEHARSLKVGVVAGLEKDRRAEYSKLSKMKGSDFDRAYMKDMVKDHEKAVKLFKTYSKEGKHEGLRTFAKKTLPTLEKHLKEAKEISARLRK
jgi:putative membrane protein